LDSPAGFDEILTSEQAILWFTAAYNGPAAEAEAILAPFNAIPAISSEQGDVPYPEIIFPQDTAASSCGSGNFAISSVLLHTYNITTQRQLYNLFNQKAAQYPEISQYARMYHEGYAVAGMQAVDPASTAYPHRDQNHLVYAPLPPPTPSSSRGGIS
jgi:hypothetical protein